MAKLLLLLVFFSSFGVQAGYIAEFERENKQAGTSETLTLRTFGRNAMLLIESKSGDAHGWLYFDGGDYLVRRNVAGDWRLIGVSGHGAGLKTGAQAHTVRPQNTAQEKLSIQLNDLEHSVKVASYPGSAFDAEIYERGQLSTQATIVLSQHHHVTNLRDDYFALLEGMSRRAGEVIDKNKVPKEMGYMRVVSVMARGGLIAYDSDAISLRLASIENGTGPIFLPTAPEFPEPNALEQLAANHHSQLVN